MPIHFYRVCIDPIRNSAQTSRTSKLGGAATLGANFYTKPKSCGFKGAHSVTLQWLYIDWGQHFGRVYNITRGTMGAVVDAQGPIIASKPAKPNYNLSSGSMDR